MFGLLFAAVKFVVSWKFVGGFIAGAAAGWPFVKRVAAKIAQESKQL